MACICCQEKINSVDYKEIESLKGFVTSQYKIVPHKKTGLCGKHQRKVANAIKVARFMALMPYTRNQTQKIAQ